MHQHHPTARHAHDDRRRLALALLLALTFMAAEAVGGWWSGSLALLADAGHMLSDAASLAFSLFAAWIVTRAASPQQTFGYVRAEILAAAANGALLVLVALVIAWEAWERFREPAEIDAGLMAAVAAAGLVVNLVMLRILHAADHGNLNVRGAWLHVVGDTLGSVGVLAAAGLTALGWNWADPVISVLISLLILSSSVRLLTDAVGVLMEHSPSSIDVDQVRECLLTAEGVTGVHCLHVWSISSNFPSISAHVVLDAGRDAVADLPVLHDRLKERFRVEHVTLQLEPPGFTGCGEALEEFCRRGPQDAPGCI